MLKLNIELPDGSRREYDAPVTPLAVAQSIGKRLAEASIAARVDGKEVDVGFTIQHDARIALITRDSKEGLEVLRHSTAHLLAHAIKELYPETQITIGPVIEDGFYYDIDCPKMITPEDLTALEAKMTEIAARNLDVKRSEMPREEAVAFFRKQGEKYKAEIIEGLSEGKVSLYTQGEFTDLCRGPHVPNTAKLGKFKLLSVAGAYWRGDERNKMLQRIYGTAFATQKELDEHLFRLEEAKRRDHRKLGTEMNLFSFLSVAPAMPFYLPKGAQVFNNLVDFMRKEVVAAGYQEVICPQILNSELWKRSGHWENYRENMFCIAEDEGDTTMGLKPMNCPGHCALYGTSLKSYRDLPLRYAEFTKLHRNERAGVTHGLFRTRAFCQDDAHIFCTPDQVQAEAIACIEHTFRLYKLFGFSNIEVRLATRPENYIGSLEVWERATKDLEQSLNTAGVPFKIAEGEGAFYGPKIEFHIQDSLARSWQCGTVQLDPNLPERFLLEYTDSDNTARRPVMIHRAIFGSVERFMGILIEHYGGHFPVWLAPVQAKVINVTDEALPHAQEVLKQLHRWGVRAESDFRVEKLGYRIREAQLQRIPIMLVIGNKEAQSSTVSVRRANGETTNDLTLESLRTYMEPLLNPGGYSH